MVFCCGVKNFWFVDMFLERVTVGWLLTKCAVGEGTEIGDTLRSWDGAIVANIWDGGCTIDVGAKANESSLATKAVGDECLREQVANGVMIGIDSRTSWTFLSYCQVLNHKSTSFYGFHNSVALKMSYQQTRLCSTDILDIENIVQICFI